LSLAAAMNGAMLPLLVELSAEILFPIEASVCGSFLTGAQNIVATLYISCALFPSLGKPFIPFPNILNLSANLVGIQFRSIKLSSLNVVGILGNNFNEW
jgi:hypothetical protein